uniref:Kinetochore protein SPC25 n=1 Tax=Leersia perrieri TaxID=77586 RepID=A0A0D9WBY5_9ORYZ
MTQGELGGLKLELQNLEIHAVEALSNKVSRESECQLAKETISSTTAIYEKLKSLVTDNRNKRDQRTTVISNHLEAVEALEAKCKEDETHWKSIEEAVLWYSKFLGFQVVGGEGVKFIFNKVDLENPDKEYSVTLKLDKDRYTLLQCYPSIKDCEELMKDLNLTNDLFKFVRTVRQRFQAEAANVIVLVPLDSRIENVPDKSLSRGKNKTQGRPSKRRAAALSAASPGDVGIR